MLLAMEMLWRLGTKYHRGGRLPTRLLKLRSTDTGTPPEHVTWVQALTHGSLLEVQFKPEAVQLALVTTPCNE